MHLPTTRRLAVSAVLVVVVATASFSVTRALHSSTDTRVVAALATPASSPQTSFATPGPSSTPLSANPDTTQGGWALPYLEADRLKPTYDQTINGITVGPTAATIPTVSCQPGSAQELALNLVDQTAAAPVMVAPKYLPAGTVRSSGKATVCQNAAGQTAVIGVDATYSIPADLAHGQRGGSFMVSRSIGNPSVRVSIPAERWSAGSIAGHAAAIAHPILANGLGHSAIVVSNNGIITTLQADNLTLDDLQRIAVGLF